MTDPAPLTSGGGFVRWAAWEGQGVEHCHFSVSQDGLTLNGVVVGNRDGEYGARYLVRADAAGRTRHVYVEYMDGSVLDVSADADARWIDNTCGEALPELQGCLDVDIGVTPATNALPIRRLKLSDGASAEIRVAYVPLPSQISEVFRPRLADQRYTRLGANLYRYHGLFRNFTAELAVDSNGMVLDYPGYFRRLSDKTSPT